MTTTAEQRRAVVQEALSWCGTPYHHHARIKGAGVDCGMLLAEIYERTGVIPHVDPGPYPQDWHLHREENRYLEQVERFAVPTKNPKAGDIALFQYGRCISHGAIVVDGRRVVHSFLGLGVVVDDLDVNLDMAARLRGFWTMWGEA